MIKKDYPTMSVSYFTGIRSKNPEVITLEQFITGVCNGRWKLQTDNYRLVKARGQEKEAARLKNALPAITVACICHGGHQEKNIQRLTGLIPIDLDHTDDRTEEVFRIVCRLPYVVAAMISVSNAGVKAIVRAPVDRKENYFYFFDRASRRIAEETGAVVDSSGKNINRLCFVSHHPEAYYNPDAIEMSVRDIAYSIGPKVDFGQNEPITDPGEIAFRKAMKDLNKKQLYIKGNRNNYIYALLCMLRRRKITEAEAKHWCLHYFELPEEELVAIVKSAYKIAEREMSEEEHEQRRVLNENKRKEAIAQIEDFIKQRYELRYNLVMKQTEVCRKEEGAVFEPMTDYEENSMLRELLQDGYKISSQLLHNVLNSNLALPYDPFTDYFEHLPLWDGKTDFIGQLMATVITTQPRHWEKCFRKWLVAMVAGWLYPEVVNHTVLMLIGRQGIYKTTWSLNILPPELKRYRYSGVVDTNSRDGKFTLAQCGLVNFEEVENLTRKELNKFKALVTQSVINERTFYGRNKEYMVRRASIIGSGNSKEILTDTTGNRRWLCFEVTAIKPLKENQIPYQGIYAQAKALIDSGFRYWFDYDEIEELNRQNTEFVLRSVEEEQLAVWFRKPEEGEPHVLMTASQIMGRFMQHVHAPMTAVNVGRALKAAGYESLFLHKGVKVYKVIERTHEDVKRQGMNT